MSWERDIADIKKLAGISEFTGYKPYEGSNISITGSEKRRIEREQGIEPGTDEWFRLWFSLPHMTGESPLEKRKTKNENSGSG